MTDEPKKLRKPHCKDCKVEFPDDPPSAWRPAPFPGPRCATHNRKVRNDRRAAAHERRVQDVYSLPEGAYAALYAAQGGHCALCPATGKRKRLAVDHDHTCCPGKESCGDCVRGLLCTNCNDTLAHVRDTPQRLRDMAAYLEHPPAQEVVHAHLSRVLEAGEGDKGGPLVQASQDGPELRCERNHGSDERSPELPGVAEYTAILDAAYRNTRGSHA